MKKILAGILIGTLCIGSLSACGKNTSEEKSSTLSETTNSTNETEVQTEKVLETEAADLNDTVPFSMSDIEWDIEENIVNGTRKYAISYTNNTKYDMLGLDITYSRKSGVTDEQMLNVFSDVQSEYDYEDSEIENLQLNACNYAFIVSGEKADKEASYVAGDVHGKDFKEITEEQFSLFEPDTAKINYISGDKIYTAKHVKGYETAILAGAIFGNLLTVHQIRIPLGIFGLVLMGVLFGIFVGGWILALAEIVNIFPIFARRIGITKGYSLIVIAIAAGKTAGSLYHFYRRWGM